MCVFVEASYFKSLSIHIRTNFAFSFVECIFSTTLHVHCTMEQYTCGKDTNVTSVTVLEHRTGICSTSTYGLETRLFTLFLRFEMVQQDKVNYIHLVMCKR